MSQVHEKLSDLPRPEGDHLPPELHIVRSSMAPRRLRFFQMRAYQAVFALVVMATIFAVWSRAHAPALKPLTSLVLPTASEIKTEIEHGKAAAAIATLEAATQADPQSPANFINIAYAYKALGQLPQAESALQKALSLNPASAAAYNNMGRVKASKREWPAAISFYKKALEMRRDYADAQMNLAAAYEAVNAWEQSVATYQDFLRDDLAHRDLHPAIEKRIRLLRALGTYSENHKDKS